MEHEQSPRSASTTPSDGTSGLRATGSPPPFHVVADSASIIDRCMASTQSIIVRIRPYDSRELRSARRSVQRARSERSHTPLATPA